MNMQWRGVMPAITTPFNADLSVDYAALGQRCQRLIAAGCTGVVALGSLGEGATLEAEEKRRILAACVAALQGKAPVVAGISALSTAQAVALARVAEASGCDGIMALPPYVYAGDWGEMKAHIAAILNATRLPAMLYNNPIAYGTDFLPAQIAELAKAFPQLAAVKESSGDARRIAALRALMGERLALLVGLDDCIVEGVMMGAQGWIAGLANALPQESVALFEAAREHRAEAFELYRWFLPLLRMDTVPKFVQLIKLAEEICGVGSPRVRPPRLELTGEERETARATIQAALASRPTRHPAGAPAGKN